VAAQKPTVLFASPVLRHPPNGGPTLRIENSIRALSQVADLFVYARASPESIGGDDAVAYYRQYCRDFFFTKFVAPENAFQRLARRAVKFLARRIVKRHLVSGAAEPRREDMQQVIYTADAIGADIIWLGYGNISYPLLKYIKNHSPKQVVIDTDSVWSRYVLRGVPYAHNAAERAKAERLGRKKEAEERWGTQLADVTTAVSSFDAAYYRSLAQSSDKVHVFSNVIDIAHYEMPQPPPANFRRPSLLLAGTFWPGSPMEDAARWIIREVLPKLQKQAPGLHTYILGQGSDRTLANILDPNISVTGPVVSVLPYLQHATVAVVPLRFESGTRFKILEAGACGLPVVSTTLGAEGTQATSGQHLLLADTPEQFADGILRLLSDRELAARLGSNLRALVRAHYGLDTLVREGQTILEYLRRPSTGGGPV